MSRSASNSGSRSTASRRRSGNPLCINANARCRIGLARPARAFASKVLLVASISLPRNADRWGFFGHASEHLGDMADLNPPAMAMELARDVQQATEVPGQDRRGAGLDDFGLFVADHLVRNVRIFDAKRAAKAAACLGSGQFLERQPGDRAKQPARLVLNPELAQSGAGVMIGDLTVPVGGNRPHPADVDEKRDELPAACGETLGPRQNRRIIGEKLRVMNAEHPGTGARRCDDMIVALEDVEHLLRDRLSVGAVARIVGGLTAAGLGARHLDRAARRLEQSDSSKADRRPKEIYQTGHEKRYTHGARPSPTVSGLRRSGN